MKLITIQVTEEEHKAIKLAATKLGLTIKDYLLGHGYKKVTRVEGGIGSSHSSVKIEETTEPINNREEHIAKELKQVEKVFKEVSPTRNSKNKN